MLSQSGAATHSTRPLLAEVDMEEASCVAGMVAQQLQHVPDEYIATYCYFHISSVKSDAYND
jgi:hypothetical protein